MKKIGLFEYVVPKHTSVTMGCDVFVVRHDMDGFQQTFDSHQDLAAFLEREFHTRSIDHGSEES